MLDIPKIRVPGMDRVPFNGSYFIRLPDFLSLYDAQCISFSYREYFMRIILPCLIMTAVIPLLLIQINNLLDTSFFKLIIESLSSIVLTSLLLYFLLFSGAEKNLAKQFLSKILRK